jgi:hypothetical protein
MTVAGGVGILNTHGLPHKVSIVMAASTNGTVQWLSMGFSIL